MLTEESTIHERINELNISAWKKRYSHGKESLDTAKKAYNLAVESNYIVGKAEALMYINMFQFWFSEETNYLDNLFKAKDWLQNIKNDLLNSRLENILAGLYDHYGEYENALMHNINSIIYATNVNALSELSDALTTKGQLSLRLNDFSRAVKSFHKALRIRKELKDYNAVSSSLNLLARTHTLMKDYKAAVNFYQQALLIRKENNDVSGMPWTYLGLATVFNEEGNEKKAIEYYNIGLKLPTVKREKFEMACRKGLGQAYLKHGNINTAEGEFKLAYKLSKSIKSKPVEAELSQLLSEVHKQKGDYHQAYNFLSEYVELKEEIMNGEIANRLKYNQIAHAAEKTRRKAEIFHLKHVELKNAFDAIELKNKEILDSISYAQRIQNAILPTQKLINSLLPNSFILFFPKDIVSGDFYWVEKKAEKIFFTVADCTGHGVPGALVSIIGKIGLDRILNEYDNTTPAIVLSKLAQMITDVFGLSENNVDDGMDMALCALDKESGILEYAGAKNPLYLLRDGDITIYKAERQSIQSTTQKLTFTNHSIQLKKADRIYMFSDGYVDQFGGENDKRITPKRLRQAIIDSQKLTLKEQKKYLSDFFFKWKGKTEQTDDMSLFCMQV